MSIECAVLLAKGRLQEVSESFMFLFLRLSRPGLDGLSSLALLFDILNEEHRDCWLAASSWYL